MDVVYSSGVLSFENDDVAVDLALADDYTIFVNDDGDAETVTASSLARDYDTSDSFTGTVYVFLNDDGEVAEVYVCYDGSTSSGGSDGEDDDTVPAELDVVVDGRTIYVYNPTNEDDFTVALALEEALSAYGYTGYNLSLDADGDLKLDTDNTLSAKYNGVSVTLTVVFAENGGTASNPETVNLSDATGEIALGSGVFELTGSISSDLTISGNGDTTIVPATEGGSAIQVSGDAELTLENVTISSDSERGMLVRNATQDDTGTITLDGCTFEGGRFGVYIDGLSGGSITNCTFRDYAKAAIGIGDSLSGELEISDNDYGTDTDDTVFIEYVSSVKEYITGSDLDDMSEGEYSEIS